MNSRGRHAITGKLLFGVVVFTTIHAVALQMQPDLTIDLNFTGAIPSDPHIDSLGDWKQTPSGLYASRGLDEAGRKFRGLFLSVSRFRFEELYLDAVPTAEGRGKIEVIISPAKGAHVQNIPDSQVPELPVAGEIQLSEQPAWNLRLAHHNDIFDASKMVGDGGSVNLTSLWHGSGTVVVVCRPLPGVSGRLIHSLHLKRQTWKWSVLLIPCLYLVLCTAAGYLAENNPWISRWMALAGAAALVFLSILFPMDLLEWSSEIIGLMVGLCLLQFLSRRSQPDSFFWVVAVAALMFLAASARLERLFELQFQTLESDPKGFLAIARSMHWFYDSEMREPLFIFFAKMGLLLFGDDAIALRLVSFIFSVLLVPVVYFVGKQIQSPLVGLIAAAIIATSPNWVLRSGQGYRLELFTISLLLLAGSILTSREPGLRRHAVTLGLLSATVCLVRSTSLWFCLVGAAYGIFRRGWCTKAFLITAAITIIPIIPYWSYSAVTFGDPFYAVNIHAKWYRNQEFKDQPEMLTSEQLSQQPYGGPDVTPLEYFFEMHSIAELARRTFKEFCTIFVGNFQYEVVCAENRLLYWWALLSLVTIALTSRWFLLPWMIMIIGPVVWLFTANSGPEWRIFFHASAFVYLSMAISAEVLFRKLGNQDRHETKAGERRASSDVAPGCAKNRNEHVTKQL